jgi:DNA-binding transcriptional LysR family regulator
MLDGVTLDQFRTFIAAVDEGSFSAAGRRLGRAQSLVSQTLANMEGQLGLQLFDRSGRIPVLTEAGSALLPEAHAVAGHVDAFKARERGLAGGLEAELSVAIDVMPPTCVLTHAVGDFSSRFPDVPLRLQVETLGAVLQPVLDGNCAFGIIGLPDAPRGIVRERLMEVQVVPVASPSHPLARHPAPLTVKDLSGHFQLVLAERASPLGDRVRRRIAETLATGRHGSEARVPPSRLGLGRHAARPRPGRRRRWRTGHPRRRRNAVERHMADIVRGVQGGRAARSGRTMADRTD